MFCALRMFLQYFCNKQRNGAYPVLSKYYENVIAAENMLLTGAP